MLTKLKSGVVAVALVASPIVVSVAVAAPAHAAKDYANCDALQRDYPNGVARSRKAARKQVHTGHNRPAVRENVYRANNESDADNDGTACEVTR